MAESGRRELHLPVADAAASAREVRVGDAGDSTGRPWRSRTWLALAALGVAQLLVWCIGFGLHQATEAYFVAFVLYLPACVLAWRPRALAPGAPTVGLLLVVAVLLRAVAVAHDPQLSDDLYRYVWDGRVQAAGINPYLYAPDAEALAPLRDGAIWPRVNHKAQPTPYPPLSQVYFALVYRLAPESVRAMQVAAAALDLLVGLALIWLLRRFGLPPVRAVVWLWSPLAVLHYAHSGHNDPLMILPLLLALGLAPHALSVRRQRGAAGPGLPLDPLAWVHEWRRGWDGARVLFGSGGGWSTWRVAAAGAGSALALGLAVLAKLVPLLLVPLFLPWWGLVGLAVFGLVVALGYLPYLGAGAAVLGGLATEGGEAIFNDGAFWLIRQAMKLLGLDPVAGAKVVVAAALVALAAWLALRTLPPRSPALAARAYTLLATYLALGAVVMPWYVGWLLPFLALALRPAVGGKPSWLGFAVGPSLGWLFFSGLVELSDLAYIYPDVPYLWTWIRLAEWTPLALLAAWPLVHARLRRPAAAVASRLERAAPPSGTRGGLVTEAEVEEPVVKR